MLCNNWSEKEGAYTADDAAVEARAKVMRESLRDLTEELEKTGSAAEGKKDVVVVTHGAFMKFLAQDKSIDLPKAGWEAYTIGKRNDDEVTLLPVD